MANRSGGRNKLVVPGAEGFMDKFKNEIAAELGIADYDNLDKGALPARVHGMIGGTMTKRLIEMGQQVLSGQDTSQSNLNPQEYVKHMQQELIEGSPQAYASATVVPTPEQSLNTETFNTH